MTDAIQPELPLPAPPLPPDMPPLPARMINEYQYCPRLAYLEWVQGEWQESADTVEGRFRHRRVEQSSGELPEPDQLDEGERLEARALTLASERLGLIARMDLIEAEDGEVIPVDYKRGKRPHVPSGAYAPERVQLCVQGLILEEHGYRCSAGVLYFVESRERVRVAFDAELRAETLQAVNGLRLMAQGGRIPPPLDDSPKCPRCSLVGICLPDEVNFLRRGGVNPRPLAVPRDDALPLYVQAYKARIAKAGETVEITVEDQPATKARLVDISQVVLLGNVSITTPCVHEFLRREIPVSWHSYGGWFLGHSVGVGHKNVELRTAQYRGSFEPAFCLGVARSLVAAKIRNARTLLRRNWREAPPPEQALADLKRHAERAQHAAALPELLGIEGNAAAIYFGHFAGMLKRSPDDPTFDFAQRNRRPPADPVNALLSFAYTLLVRTITVTISAVGLDPYRGFYHQPRYGRPALALDLMEPFRPLIAESAVIQAINNGEVQAGDFLRAAGSVALKAEGRKRFIAAFERRLSQEATHPIFEYRASYRRIIELQARLLGRHLLGEIPEYPQFLTR
ncbi:MAG: CRISPR-associated endonuclease Cas1 [Defluviicoccus sp.]|nr:CRISPR-associated endonuclease Cas1 [Defluviicoccus sp.]MDG4591280.1 CRISPR-associated endonuclease Cas1 [Defluviicoccus sp.]